MAPVIGALAARGRRPRGGDAGRGGVGAPGARPAAAVGPLADAATIDGLMGVLDPSRVALLLYDSGGRVLRATAIVEVLLAEDCELATVLEYAARAARDALDAPVAGAHAPRAVRRLVRTRHWEYELVGGRLAPCTVAGGAAAAVVVERGRVERLSDEAMRARFGLSVRESEVARLAAEGRSTPRIAEALGISPHTARHHLERVFAKVGVRTRVALQAVAGGGGMGKSSDVGGGRQTLP